MNKGMVALVSGAALLAGMGAASADDPVRLSGEQLDGVTAGGPTFFEYTKLVQSFNFEEVFADVFLNGTIVQAAADAETAFVGTGDFKVETAAIATFNQGTTMTGQTVNFVTSQSLALIAIENND